MFLITISELTHKVISTEKFLGEYRFVWRDEHQIMIFAKIFFAVREQLHRFRTKPTPDYDSP